jgi:hypothetical protein
MDDKLQGKIAQAAQADYGWQPAELRVDEATELRRGSCSFFEVRHKVKPLSYVVNYALLADGAVVGLKDKDAVPRILDACGSDAPPAWWAEVVARFHADLGGGVVLKDANQDNAVTRKLNEAGKSFAPPAVSSEGGAKILTFYWMEYEAYVLYHVTVTRRDGAVEVSKVEVF